MFDQYLNFLSLEKDLFSFSDPASYVAFNDPTLSDSQAEANMDAVVESLMSVLVTMVNSALLLVGFIINSVAGSGAHHQSR